METYIKKLLLDDEPRQQKAIMLINSEQILMDITGRILERAGYAVRTAIGSAGAEELLADYTPDAIMLSNELPDAEGLEYCRELRKKISVPIMYMSNNREDELQALKAGANDFLKKPFDSEILKYRLSVMMNDVSDHKNAGKETENAKNESNENEAPGLQETRFEEITGPIKVKRKPRTKHIAPFLASYAALILIGVFLLSFVFGNASNRGNSAEDPGNTGVIDFIEGGVPMSEFPIPIIDSRAIPFAGAEQGDTIYIISDAAFPANVRDVAILLANPEQNSCYQTFEIILSDGSETIYKSDMIGPGMCLENITLTRGLAEGQHDAILRINAYAPDSFKCINTVEVRFCISSG